MINLENVEKLREHTGVSYEDARDALKAANGDLLEALIYLERQGKLKDTQKTGHYKSSSKSDYTADGNFGFDDNKTNGFIAALKKIGKAIVYIIEKGNKNSLEVNRKKKHILSLPLTVVVLLLLVAFWLVVPLMVIGLFFGFRYAFAGDDMEEIQINEKMEKFKDKVSDFAEDVKEEFVDDFTEDFKRDYPKYKEEEDKKNNKE